LDRRKTYCHRAAAEDQPGRVRKKRIHNTVVDRLTMIERKRKCWRYPPPNSHLCAEQDDPPSNTTSSSWDTMGLSIARTSRWRFCSKGPRNLRRSKHKLQLISIPFCKPLLTIPMSGHKCPAVVTRRCSTTLSTTMHAETDERRREHTEVLH
jgi:hypothetical protein